MRQVSLAAAALVLPEAANGAITADSATGSQ
jgi:hypothetical protein